MYDEMPAAVKPPRSRSPRISSRSSLPSNDKIWGISKSAVTPRAAKNPLELMMVRGPTRETSVVDLLERILDKGIVNGSDHHTDFKLEPKVDAS